MNDKIVPLARDQVVATFPGAGIELLTVAGSDIHERHPVIGFVVTRNATYPVTGTRGMCYRPGGYILRCHARKASERIDFEHALLHPDGRVEAADGCMYQSLAEFVEIRKSAEWVKEENLRMEKRHAAYEKAKARRKAKRHLKLVTDPS